MEGERRQYNLLPPRAKLYCLGKHKNIEENRFRNPFLKGPYPPIKLRFLGNFGGVVGVFGGILGVFLRILEGSLQADRALLAHVFERKQIYVQFSFLPCPRQSDIPGGKLCKIHKAP